MDSGGGGGGTSKVILPDYVNDLAKSNIEDVKRVTERPYQPYTLARIADFTPDQQAGFQTARNSIGAYKPALDRAQSIYGNAGGFAAPTIDYAGDVSARTLPGTDLSGYMNPFIESAVNPVLRQISEKYGQDRSATNASNALGGAFGSDQAAIMNAESLRNENLARSDALAQGLYGGYDRATGLASSDANRLLQAATTNQGARFNTAAANQQAELAANQQRLAAAAGLAGLAPMAQSLGANDAQTLLSIGGAQQGLGQQSLDLAYNDFLRQQMDPFNMINLRTAVLTGQPYSVEYDNAGAGGGGKGNVLGGVGGVLSGIGAITCWLAREVYGETDPRWLAVRKWVLEKAPTWFRDLYAEHGQAWAEMVRGRPEEKARIRDLFDDLIAA